MFGICSKCGEYKEYYHHNQCRECRLKYSKEWYERNKKRVHNNNLLWKENNKEKYLQYFKDRYKNDKCNMDNAHKEYREKNRKFINSYKKKWRDEKYKTDINFRIKCLLRSRVRDALHGQCKSKSTLKLLGCSVEELKLHLEKQFKPGMSWDNHGFGSDKWHIDHIKPCSSFDLTLECEQCKCFHYSNLQPLWQFENLSKGDKII